MEAWYRLSGAVDADIPSQRWIEMPKTQRFPYLATFHCSEGYESQYPFSDGQLVAVIGEFENMRDHCVVADKDGKIYFPYHVDGFHKMGYEEV